MPILCEKQMRYALSPDFPSVQRMTSADLSSKMIPTEVTEMAKRTRSTLSMKRILISLLLIVMIPATAYLLNMFVEFYELAMMFGLSVVGSLLIVYDWNLFAIHYNRAKKAVGDTFLYTLIGSILIGGWTWVALNLLHCSPMIPSGITLIRNGYARPGMYIAYSFMLASVVNIGFKCLTDHLDVRTREIQAILISAIAGGLFFTVIFITGFDPLLWIRNYLYNMILIAILSYLYNQSSSFMPGLISMSLIHLGFMVISVL